ncbi:MAG: response regulator [Candidatus Synoicihabitans palmerolidicus]|nr:response regulator [Candidatus Synoicihabitans palmerolidicus]
MGGEIQVVSEPAKGSTFQFTISFPIASLPQSDVDPVSSGPARATSIRSYHQILVADDDAVNLAVIRKMLAQMDHQIAEASDGYKVVQRSTERPWALIFMDVQMPGLDGIEATKRIRANPQTTEIPIVAITANVMNHA